MAGNGRDPNWDGKGKGRGKEDEVRHCISLTVHCLFTAFGFHCLSAAFPWLFTVFSLHVGPGLSAAQADVLGVHGTRNLHSRDKLHLRPWDSRDWGALCDGYRRAGGLRNPGDAKGQG